MAAKNASRYYTSFVEGVEFSCRAAAMLHESLQQYNAAQVRDRMMQIHKIEHAADLAKHEMMSCLVKEFITPIEREDIIMLSQNIDDVTDAVEDVLMRAYMFNLKTVKPEALSFCGLIVSCCKAMKTMMEEFHNFRKSATIHSLIIEINHIEEEADRLYTEAVRTLYVTSADPVEIIVWTEMFNCLEKCCDECEDVANVVESIIMKNS